MKRSQIKDFQPALHVVRLGEERKDSGRAPLPHLRFPLLEPGVRASGTFCHPGVKMRKSPCPPSAQNRAGQGHTWACQVAPVVKNLPANAGDMRRGFDPWVGKIPWRRAWQPTAGRIQWTEKSGGLQSTGSQRVGRDCILLSQQGHIWAACKGWGNRDQRLRPTLGNPAPSHPQPRLLAQGKAWHSLIPGQKPGRGSRVLRTCQTYMCRAAAVGKSEEVCQEGHGRG